ncbi:uncharacterized protein YALI1_A11165g [Yarrowia lipolytica]|uniref:Uncharacterized protein n=1 Tax=Yarrowia lipolytica TaxID=4952 RepID=A0A1D8N4F1_YARLL|nr:hypothetical protein YALI1_A11165g [Yarrowia lipolytica]
MMKEDIQRAPLRRNSYEIPSRPALTYKLYANQPVSRQRNTLVIRLLLKDGDPIDVVNYRPISLIELKIFSSFTLLASYAENPELHPAQAGFVLSW